METSVLSKLVWVISRPPSQLLFGMTPHHHPGDFFCLSLVLGSFHMDSVSVFADSHSVILVEHIFQQLTEKELMEGKFVDTLHYLNLESDYIIINNNLAGNKILGWTLFSLRILSVASLSSSFQF